MSNYRNDEALATMFAALSNPHRLALFRELCTCCAPGTSCSVDEARMCVGDLGDSLDIAASTLSHHLKTLRVAGLIQTERRGKNVMCWVDPAVLNELSAFFAEPLLTPSANAKGSSCCPPGESHV